MTQTPDNKKSPAQNAADTTGTPEVKKKSHVRLILWLIFIFVIIAVPVIIYFVKDIQINNLKKDHEKEISAMQEKANAKVAEMNRGNLISVSRVFSWAVRSEIQRGNAENVGMYMTELVKIPNIQQALYVDNSGNVVQSTDAKYKGMACSNIFADAILNNNDIKISDRENGDLMVVSPVMGIGTRLGSVVITYTPQKLNFEVPVANPEKK
ncbi:MAG: hypothetical protein WCM76_02850 [Bacteroidota bacterium]